MASDSMLETFDPAVESVNDYKERFDFHCAATRLESILLLNLPIMLFGIACKISLLSSFLCFSYSNYAPKF